MYFEIKTAEYIDNYRLKLSFNDGNSGFVDLSSYLNQNNVFERFADKEYFLSYRVEFGTLVWGDGELDIAPEHLYYLATGKVVNFAEKSRWYNNQESQFPYLSLFL